ncbi:MAG: MBL fold metallo-hydrolase [Bacillota bacterium]
MRWTTLGSFGPYPPAGGACSGYLVESGSTQVLVDCGPGVFSRYLARYGTRLPDAVILSHYHGDHFGDMLVVRYAVYTWMLLSKRDEPLLVYAPEPPGHEEEMILYKDAVSVRRIVDGAEVRVGNLSFDFLRTEHSIPALAIRARDGGSVIVYSGDTGPDERITRFAQGADLFVCEAALGPVREDEMLWHMTAEEAAQAAASAGASRLLLTHMFPLHEPDDLVKAAKKFFDNTDFAYEGRTVEV